ncbi:uncharacterized protein TOT_030000351 [Theileria orientalis strain Shintoku]|uniref:Uncharacterized protein n=1 Tax=Theileria orientalis strain Shintoku TaxID=869250 RepID=J4C8N3_THEOR|nr:uncharacterized protein TOT_030000351 [Theileria orientalis strain Shintoku]BAM41088.1 uncharacterized protein TOT_030000351 [Theileria orientalis strain Shintoku]|eukprot:XP_009691389.1 uncharacterized protein TOT_030000351 [Theileria orientalis strain Shintoku]
MATNTDAMLTRIDTEIKENKFYESMQHILTFVKRNALRKKYNESLETLYKYALVYLENNQYVLSGELMDEYVKVAESGSVALTPQMVTNFVSVFETPWKTSPHSSDFNKSKEYQSTMSLFTKFMNRAILYSKSVEFPNGNPELHKSLGSFYKQDKQYIKAQANLVYSQDVELLFESIKEWKEEENRLDGDYYYLRAVLMLLASRDVLNAKCFVYMLDCNLEDPKTPVQIRVAHLLSESCDPPDPNKFQDICEKYSELFNADKEYSSLLKSVKHNYFRDTFNPGMNNQPGVENALSGFLRAFM